MNRLIGILLTLALLLAACAGQQEEPSAPGTFANPSASAGQPGEAIISDYITVRIGWSPPNITGVFATVTQFMEAAAETARPYGINIEFIEHPDTDYTGVTEQIAAIESFISQGADVIIVSPTDVDSIVPALRDVNAADIPLIMINMMEEIPEVDVTSFIGFDNSAAASVTGWSMVNALGGPGPLPAAKEGSMDVPADTHLNLEWWENLYSGFDRQSVSGNVAIIEGSSGDYFANVRNRGFLEVIDSFPNINILTIIPGDWNREVSVSAAENILYMFGPGNIDAIFAPDSEMGIGARIAAENAGREDDVMILTQGGTAESSEWTRDQKLTADTWHGFPDWGWYGVQFAVMQVMGHSPPYMFDIGARTQWQGNAHMFYPYVQLPVIPWQEILDSRV